LRKMEKVFLDERTLKVAAVLSVLTGLASAAILGVKHDLTLLALFGRMIKTVITLLTLWSFSRYHWDAMKGMLGGLLFGLMYQESFLVLGELWGATNDFDVYLIMGVQGSLYLAAQSVSFLMTIIIIINHFVISYSRAGDYANVLFNRISILFKIALYISLMLINSRLDLPLYRQISAGLEYIADLAVVVMIICIESQLDSFKRIKQELLDAKRKQARHE